MLFDFLNFLYFLLEIAVILVYNKSMLQLDPNPNASLAPLENIFWDYNFPLTGKDIYDFVLGEKEISYLNRDEVRARVLMNTEWYKLIDIFGLKNLASLITGNTLKWVWVDDLRKQYAHSGSVIKRTISEALPVPG